MVRTLDAMGLYTYRGNRFDPYLVLSRVFQGKAPPEWHIYRLKRWEWVRRWYVV